MSDECSSTTVSASIGALEVEVTGHDLDEAEEVFERVWAHRLQESEEMSDALRARLGGFD